jgi:hypothetical protein
MRPQRDDPPDGEGPACPRTIGAIAVVAAAAAFGEVGMKQMVESTRRLRSDQIGTSARSALSALVPLRIVRDAWWLALVAIGVLQQAHAGLHEHRELTPLVHLLRDAALAVPAAAIAIVLASGLVAGRWLGRAARPPSVADRILWVLVAAAVFAVLSVPGNELHGALFGAEDEAELSEFADLALDAGIALIGASLALVPLAVVAGVPIQDPAGAGSRSPERPRPVLETSARSSQ